MTRYPHTIPGTAIELIKDLDRLMPNADLRAPVLEANRDALNWLLARRSVVDDLVTIAKKKGLLQ